VEATAIAFILSTVERVGIQSAMAAAHILGAQPGMYNYDGFFFKLGDFEAGSEEGVRVEVRESPCPPRGYSHAHPARGWLWR
jgi:hypothetical protein